MRQLAAGVLLSALALSGLPATGETLTPAPAFRRRRSGAGERPAAARDPGRHRCSPAVPTPLGFAGAKPSGTSAHPCSGRCFGRSTVEGGVPE